MFELRKWEPFRELSNIQKEMDDLFRRVFRSMTSPTLLRKELKGEWYPVFDCYTKDNKLVLHADLPGMDAKDVDISIVGNTLTIKGERKGEVEEKKGEYLFHETSYGAFERSFTLPEGADTSKVHATYKSGVLELTMPVKALERPKKVKVSIEGEKGGEKAA